MTISIDKPNLELTYKLSQRRRMNTRAALPADLFFRRERETDRFLNVFRVTSLFAFEYEYHGMLFPLEGVSRILFARDLIGKILRRAPPL